jgi:Lysine methyltransferase
LTGLELASQLSKIDDDCQSIDTRTRDHVSIDIAVLLTDLETALPLLQRNISLNINPMQEKDNNDDDDDRIGIIEKEISHQLTSLSISTSNDTVQQTNSSAKILSSSTSTTTTTTTVQAMKLDWSNINDSMDAIRWFQLISQSQHDAVTTSTRTTVQQPSLSIQSQTPILIIGSDCVYWESLHEPLRCCLFTLLSNAPVGSICLLAGMRRWKRDTSFYNSLNSIKNSNTSSKMECICLYEQVVPKQKEDDQREIMRIYAIYLSSR